MKQVRRLGAVLAAVKIAPFGDGLSRVRELDAPRVPGRGYPGLQTPSPGAAGTWPGRRCARTGWVELKSGRVKQGRRLCRRAWWGARAKAQMGQDALDHRRIDDGGDDL